MKIGIFGTGHLGKIHIKCLQASPWELVGFFDPDDKAAAKVSQEFGLKRYETPEALMHEVDAVDIVSPTFTHFDVAKKAIEMDKHIFVEKPVTRSLEEAEALYQMNESKGLKIQVGHVERYNPAMVSIDQYDLKPKFIEGHRLAQFNPRGTDVSVILDLMIHDLDIVLSLVDSEVESVLANGVNIVSDTEDICNARIQFANGCVANLTASRISLKNMRKIRVFQNDAYISMDFLDKESQVVRLLDQSSDDEADNIGLEIDTKSGKKRIIIETPDVEHTNAIQTELTDFYNSVKDDAPVKVPLKDGYKALELAHMIQESIKQSLEKIA